MRKAIKTDKAPVPVAHYSQAIVEGDFVFVAGQGPASPTTRKIESPDVKDQTRQTLENVKAILAAAGSSMDKVVKVNVYLRDIKNFQAMNEVYKSFFSEPPPARTTVQAGLGPGMEIEIDCVARK